MQRITLLALPNAVATTLLGPMDVFFMAGQLWNHIHGQPLTPYFEIDIVSPDGQPVHCLNRVSITPHKAMADVGHSDLILIPSVPVAKPHSKRYAGVLEWLCHQHRQGAHLASVCTGAFLLAETGLLDGKTATTHWGWVDAFRTRYPRIRLRPERLITDEGNLYCAGALAAALDLAVYLVEKYCGHRVAVQCAKALIHDMSRRSQAPYSVFQFQKSHADEAVKQAQVWLEANYHQEIDLNRVARENGMSRRTFERRFKHATGDTPLCYLQRTRVEAAKRLMEEGDGSFDAISYQLGYRNSGHFREVFKKHTGLLPTDYQKQFCCP